MLKFRPLSLRWVPRVRALRGKGSVIMRPAMTIPLVLLTLSSCEGDSTPGDVRDGLSAPNGAESTGVRGSEWGPLAVIESTGGGDDALITGTIEITDACAFINDGGQRTLLVWPDSRVDWLASRNAIQFLSGSGNRVTLESQDLVTFSGGGSSDGEGGMSREEFLQSTDWLARPPSECVVGSRWFIADVVESR